MTAGWANSALRNRLKRAIRFATRKFGYDIVPHLEFCTLSSQLEWLFAHRAVNCVIDVGAHCGEYGRMLRQFGYRGDIVSFEPVEASFAVLRERAAADPRWRVHRLALGKRDGTERIQVASSSNFSSFLSPNEYSASRFGAASQVAREEVVEMRRLDGLLDSLVAHIERPTLFLKIDAQGYDMVVLEGATEKLHRFGGLQVELPVKHIYRGMPDFPSSLARLSQLGFEITGMFPVVRERDQLRVIEFDCVFVRGAGH